MKQPEPIEFCVPCLYYNYNGYCTKATKVVPDDSLIPSWCPLPDAVEKVITFTRQELHQIMIGGKAGYEYAPSDEKEHIDYVCYEINKAIDAKLRDKDGNTI